MRATALTSATPDARAMQNRTGSDGSPPDDGFDTALADVAHGGSDAAKAVATTGANGTASVQVSPDLLSGNPGQAVAALLAKVAAQTKAGGGADAGAASAATVPVRANDAGDPLAAMSALLPGLVPTAKAAARASAGDAGATNDSAKTSNDAHTAAAGPDPLAAMAALLPGLVAAPAAATATPAAAKDGQPSSEPALSLTLGAMSSAKGLRSQDAAKSTDDAPDAPDVGFTLVASSTHLAPVPSASALGMPRAASAAEASNSDFTHASKAASAESVAAPSLSASAGADSHDLASLDAVATRAEPGAKLPDGTLQAIAGAVTSLAADVTPAASDIAQSAASNASAMATDPTTTLAAPARSLTLQLTPGDLGSVTVRLHMTANGLDVDLAVDDRKTLASISHARDELASAIGDNGYRVDSLTIRGADASSTSTAGSNDSARSQGESGAGQSFSGGGSGSSGGDSSPSRQRAPQSSAAPRDAGRDRGADGVFV